MYPAETPEIRDTRGQRRALRTAVGYGRRSGQ
jgi:hypothetical protein